MTNPLISIITPAYNAARFIGETIESVLKQTYTNWEMVIVDDRSTDKTVQIVEEYQKKDQRIKLIQLEENSGSAVARNTAMENSAGQFIAFLDSDDMWYPTKLERQLRFMQKNDIAFSFTKFERIQENGKPTGEISNVPKSVGYRDLMKHCVIGCLTVMLDMSKIGDVKMYNIRTRQDYVFWLTITKNGHRAYGLPEVLAKYRLVENSISRNKWKAAKKNWYVYRHIEKQNLLMSIWYFLNYAIRNILKILAWKRKLKKI